MLVSRDGTEEEAAALAGEGYPVRLITRTGERGLSTAVIRGFSEGRGDILICMDADMSHPPEVLPKLIQTLGEDQTDFVIGSRYVPGASTDESWGAFRWINSKVATLLAASFTRAKDPMSGFFALRRDTFEAAEELRAIGYKIGLELIVKCRCRCVREVPIHFADRQFGQSKLSLREQLNYIRHIKRLADFKYGSLSHLLQFCAVGATGMVVDLGSLNILLHSARRTLSGTLNAEQQFMIVRAIAILIAMTWNFWLNRHITFSYSRRQKVLRQYVRFFATCSVGGAMNWCVSNALVGWVTWFAGHVSTAALGGIVVGTFFNFAISRWWVFRAS